MRDYTIKAGTYVEVELYGRIPEFVQPIRVLCFQDRHYSEDQLFDEYEYKGEKFYVFSTSARECSKIPCSIGVVINEKDLIKN